MAFDIIPEARASDATNMWPSAGGVKFAACGEACAGVPLRYIDNAIGASEWTGEAMAHNIPQNQARTLCRARVTSNALCMLCSKSRVGGGISSFKVEEVDVKLKLASSETSTRCASARCRR